MKEPNKVSISLLILIQTLRNMNRLLRKLYFISGLIFLISVGFSSCYKTDDFNNMAESEWSPDFSIPIVNADVTVNDIFLKKESPEKIVINDENIVEVHYFSENYSAMAGDMLSLPLIDQSRAYNLSPDKVSLLNQAALGTQLKDTLTWLIDYPLSGQGATGAKLDSVWLRDGILIADLQTNIPQKVQCVLNIPSARINGQAFTRTALLNPEGAGGVAHIEAALSGAVIDLNSQQKLEVQLITEISKTTSQTVPVSGHYTAGLKIKEQEFTRVGGYFPGLDMPIVTNDTLFLRIFKNAIDADILDFQKSSARITVQNSCGIPLKSTLNAFTGFRPGASIPPLNLSGTSYPVDVPAISQAGIPGKYIINFNNSNGSNIGNVLNQFPRYMTNQTSHVLQHGADTSVHHFLYDTSRIHVNAEVNLPLDGLTLNLSLLDTFNFEFAEVTDEVVQAMIRVIVNNGFPSDGNLQVYFCREGQNQNGQPEFTTLDSLYSGARPVLKTGVVNPANGKVIQPTLSVEDAYMTGVKWKSLRDAGANRIRIRARLTTYDGGVKNVKIYEDNRLNIKIAAQFKLKTSF